MEWVKAARVFYGREEVREWIDACCHEGDVRMWLPFIDDILSSCNEVSRWYYTTMQRQYEDDLNMWRKQDLRVDPNPLMITFRLYPDSPQPSGYVNFTRWTDVHWTYPLNMYFSSNDVVY